jgi:hypothetical protein
VSCAVIEEDSRGFGGILGDLDGVSVSSARAAALQWMLGAHGEGCRVEGTWSCCCQRMDLQMQLKLADEAEIVGDKPKNEGKSVDVSCSVSC